MAIQSQSQQIAGFAIGGNATVPTYLLPAKTINHEPSDQYSEAKMALGSVDNLYYNALVGYNSLPFSFTLLLDEVICPVLLATALNSTTTGTTPNFVNTLNIRNTIASSGALTIDNQKLTFFVTDGDNGIIRYTNKVFGEFNLTVGVEGLDAEFTFDSGEREVLTSTALTNAQTAFTTLKSNLETALNALKVSLAREVNLDDYYQFAKPAGATIVYGSDYTFATSTVSKADFGFSVGFSKNLVEATETASAPGTFVNPTMYSGGFTSSFEYTIKTFGNDLLTRKEANTATCFRIRIERNVNRRFDFIFSPSSFVVQNTGISGDSDDPLKQTVTQEKAVNTFVNPSFKMVINSGIDLQTLLPN